MSLPDHGDQDDRVEHVNIANEIFRQHVLRSLHRDQQRKIFAEQDKIIAAKKRILRMQYYVGQSENSEKSGQSLVDSLGFTGVDKAGFSIGGKTYAKLQITLAERQITTATKEIESARQEQSKLRKYDQFYDQVPEHRNAQGYYGYIVALDINPATAEAFLRIRNHFHRGVAPGISVFTGPPEGGMYSAAARNLTIEQQQRYAGRRRVNSDMLGTQPSTYFSPAVWNRRQQKNHKSILY